jgi:hypothetical protein
MFSEEDCDEDMSEDQMDEDVAPPQECQSLNQSVLWIRIREDPKLFIGSGSGTGLKPYQNT